MSGGGTAKHVPAFALSAAFVVSLSSVQTCHVPAGKRSLHSPSLTPDFTRCARWDVFLRDLLRPHTPAVGSLPQSYPAGVGASQSQISISYVLDISRGVFGSVACVGSGGCDFNPNNICRLLFARHIISQIQSAFDSFPRLVTSSFLSQSVSSLWKLSLFTVNLLCCSKQTAAFSNEPVYRPARCKTVCTP